MKSLFVPRTNFTRYSAVCKVMYKIYINTFKRGPHLPATSMDTFMHQISSNNVIFYSEMGLHNEKSTILFIL